MIHRFALLAVVTLSLTFTFTARAQQTLADMVTEANSGWMMGKWQAETDSGGRVTLAFSWELNQKVIVLHVKTDDLEAKGYSVLEPGASQVSYFGIDDRGAVSRGSWNLEDGELVLRLDIKRSETENIKVALVFTGAATEGLRMRMHGIEGGSLAQPERLALRFKKQ